MKEKHNLNSRKTFNTRYCCDVCDKIYLKKSSLKIHFRNIHDQLKSYECNICGRKFMSDVGFDSHQKIHNGPREKKAFKCAICKRRFKSLNGLDSHTNRHHL